MLPSAHPSPQPKWHLNRFSQADSRMSGMSRQVLSPKIAPSHGASGPHLIHASLGTCESITQTASWSVQLLLHSSRQGVVGHALPPSKLPLPMEDLDHLLIRGSSGPPDSASQTASWQVQPILHSWQQTVSILYNGCGPHLIHDSLSPLESSTQTASQLVELFLQGSLLWQSDR